MRNTAFCLLVVAASLASGSPAWGQAGRYIPIPRLPPGGGGGVPHFVPHVPHVPGHGGGGDSDAGWVVLGVVAALVLAGVGWCVGRALARRIRGEVPRDAAATGSVPAAAPPLADLVLTPAEVADKARKTERLLEFLAREDPLYDPRHLHARAADVFRRVQEAWQARDYGPVAGLLLPGVRARHETQLCSMRDNHEVNRLDGLKVERLELVHVDRPATGDGTVTALVTFAACSYFVDDRFGAYARGSRLPALFQEFWVFRRVGDAWLLDAIERDYESDRLERPNDVAGLSERQLESAQECIAL